MMTAVIGSSPRRVFFATIHSHSLTRIINGLKYQLRGLGRDWDWVRVVTLVTLVTGASDVRSSGA